MLEQPGHRGPDGTGLSDKSPGSGLCGGGGDPVWFSCPAAPGAAKAKTTEALPAPGGQPVPLRYVGLSARPGHPPGAAASVYPGWHSLREPEIPELRFCGQRPIRPRPVRLPAGDAGQLSDGCGGQ